ncbi:hypothetical protein OIHEL45_12230 [Sulfitobacter indolifex HEL-45]|uniref:Uncharacterized protein n=1 Tax=Sulfitobacter indolifex HEL-45 TaxID=391624 RepID=A0ABP2D7G8_9RHOB|nr:hypothetical protein OIHEL45_12230 [Sulfitobacter indolifex HEL-45]
MRPFAAFFDLCGAMTAPVLFAQIFAVSVN